MQAQSRADHQPRHIVAACGHEVAHMALPVGCDGDGRWRRVAEGGGRWLPPRRCAGRLNCKTLARSDGSSANLLQTLVLTINGGGARPRGASARDRRPQTNTGLDMTELLAPRPSAAEQAEEDLQ